MESDKTLQALNISLDKLVIDKKRVYNSKGIVIMDDMDFFVQEMRIAGYGSMKLEFNVVAYIISGQAQLAVNGELVECDSNSMLMLPAHSLVKDVLLSPNIESVIVCISNMKMNQLLGGDMCKWNQFVLKDKINKVKLNEPQSEVVKMYCELLRKHMSGVKDMFYAKIVESLLQMALYDVLDQVLLLLRERGKLVKDKNGALHGEQLFYRFLEVLLAATPKFHPISYYADMLSITPKYLSDLCRKYSEKPASEWIYEYTLEEIRFYLSRKELSIKEVARITGFENSSFFCQYVKQRLGCSPLEYRQRCQQLDDI